MYIFIIICITKKIYKLPIVTIINAIIAKLESKCAGIQNKKVIL